ncbi:cache domain-containing sensor histidine kinase [Paenibacillus radicis (ex Gao et al. 2016)]|uniref:histidine kinase n=1 Tax=Paenibacillus radicis (ex Gao et al. 2016) TaxID=1737354 RepID=A0A917LWZ4_9BACL|nr:sensor histidine kinase [Paenibacillus radicis (ex Gao et al. 2016)]GGG60877.1 putative two-component sensor kinase [Paenibacillus radicis (ex Gao et al. 2016)]
MAGHKRRKGLFVRLYTYFVIVIFVPLAALGLYTYYGATDKLRAQAEANMAQVVNIASYHLEQYIHNYENSTLSLLSNSDIKSFLEIDPDKYYEKYYYTSTIKTNALEPIMIRHPEVMALYVVGQDGRTVSVNNGASLDFTSPSAKAYVDKLFADIPDNGQIMLLNASISPGQQGQTITLARKVRAPRSLTYNGVLAIEVRSTELSALWQGIDLGPRGYFHIEDREGKIVYHTDASKIGQQLSAADRRGLSDGKTQSFIGKEDGEERFTIARHSSYTDWNLQISIPMEDLREPIIGIRTNIFWIGSITLVLALLLAYRFGHSLTSPIRKLRRGMKQAEKGDWNRIPLNGTQDEVDELIVSYNSMVNKLSDMIEQVYTAENTKREAELERQKAELQALQLQINPHFLYNTLETIVCFPAVQDSDEVSEIVKSMAHMLRYAVQTSLEEITVVNELKHVLNYMAILKHRYGKDFEIEVEIPSDFLLKKMVRLTLQPLIENIFQHAFFEGLEDGHRIQIQATETDQYFVVSVIDNGSGMSESALLQLRNRLETKRLTEAEGKGGIGVLNIHRRIQLVFGDNYGLEIESKLGEGTVMRMNMPKS